MDTKSYVRLCPKIGGVFQKGLSAPFKRLVADIRQV